MSSNQTGGPGFEPRLGKPPCQVVKGLLIRKHAGGKGCSNLLSVLTGHPACIHDSVDDKALVKNAEDG